MNFLKTSLLISALGLFISACGETAKNSPALPSNANQTNAQTNRAAAPTATPDELAATRQIYKDKCAACHKEDGSGGQVTIEGTKLNAENFTSEKMRNMSDEKYIKYIEDGIPDEGMPAFKGKISDAEIKNLVKLIRTEFQKK